MTTPQPDDAPRSRRPRETLLRDAAESALVDTRGQFRAPLARRVLPPWARWGVLVAFLVVVTGWILGVRIVGM